MSIDLFYLQSMTSIYAIKMFVVRGSHNACMHGPYRSEILRDEGEWFDAPQAHNTTARQMRAGANYYP